MKKWSCLAVLFTCPLLLFSCAGLGTGRMKPEGVAVIAAPAPGVSLVGTTLYTQEGRLVVAGTLHRGQPLKFPGHIDIAVAGPEGLLGKKSVGVSGLRSKRGGHMNLPFAAEFDMVPPPGSSVTVRYHCPSVADAESGC